MVRIMQFLLIIITDLKIVKHITLITTLFNRNELYAFHICRIVRETLSETYMCLKIAVTLQAPL